MHALLGSDPTDPDFAPEPSSLEGMSLLTATIDEDIERIFLRLPDDLHAVDEIRGRGEEIRDRLQMMSHAGAGGRLIRHHGDLHLGQTLRTADRWVILDFEGEPARPLTERRRKRSPLRDVAGMLRSFAYVASASALQRGNPVPDDWEDRARQAFLDGYLSRVETNLLPPGDAAIRSVLGIYELEKAVYELRYELDNRPDWVQIPVAGHRAHPRGGDRVSAKVDALVEGRTADPHDVLGAHRSKSGVKIRAYRPEAKAISVIVDGGDTVKLKRCHPAGVFEGTVKDAELPLDYELEVAYPDGNRFRIQDPYRFAPTIGELDLHLAGEGRHEELYERLGAHVREIDGRRRHVRSRCGRRPPRRSASWATSTRGTAACTRCARWARRGSGRCSCPAWATARATSSRSARRPASCA